MIDLSKWVETSPGVFDLRNTKDADLSNKCGLQESELHEKIDEYIRRNMRAYVVHSRMDRPTTNQKGVPDFIIAMMGGRTLWIEVKTRTGKLRPEQQAAQFALKALGHEYHVVRSMEDFINAVCLQKE